MSILSAIVTSLALVAFALPIGGISPDELNLRNFRKTVANGLWLVEHFSPYCTHCLAFAPTWEQLAREAETETPSVQFVQVNCVLNGDLCDLHNVKGYPTIQMYNAGEMAEQFAGARDPDLIKAFILKHVQGKEGEASPSPSPSPPPPAPPAIIQSPVLNPTGEVMALNSATYAQALKNGPTFVKFYAPWCGHCKKLAPIWKQLARHQQHTAQIAEVNCDEEGTLCQANGVKGYPSLIFFSNGAQSEYNGGRKLDQLRAFVEKASADGVRPLEKESDLEVHVQAALVVYLLIHDGSDGEVLQQVRDAAAPLLGSPVIYTTTSQTLRAKYNVPQGIHWALVALKDGDASTVTSALYSGPTITAKHLQYWLETHHLPGAVQLNQDTFQTVMNAKHSPLIVIAFSNERLDGAVAVRLRDLLKKWRVRTGGSAEVNNREVIFTWMDAQRWKAWMKSMYGIQVDEDESNLEDVKVIVTDHQRLVFWKEDRQGSDLKLTSAGTLFSAIEDIATGKVPFKHSETHVERLARYLSTKMTGLEEYITHHPLRFAAWVIGGLLLFFFVISRLLRSDAVQIERGEYSRVPRSNRLD